MLSAISFHWDAISARKICFHNQHHLFCSARRHFNNYGRQTELLALLHTDVSETYKKGPARKLKIKKFLLLYFDIKIIANAVFRNTAIKNRQQHPY